MIDRRTLLKTGLLAPVALAWPIPVLAAAPGFDALIIDTRYPEAQRIGPTPAQVHYIDGDVTTLWYHTLDRRWRRPGFVVAGYTGADTLFVLERLAWDRGRRVTQRRQVANSGADGRPLTFWVIAPRHPGVLAAS